MSSLHSDYEMTELECQHQCIKTIINMLIARRWLTINNSDQADTYNEYVSDSDVSEAKEKYFNTIVKKKSDLIDTTNILCSNGKKVAIKFYNYKLNTLKNDKEIDTFMTAYPEHHKILIVLDISSKAEKQIENSRGFEVFRIKEIIRDISKHHLVPKHILLTTEDAEAVMSEYNIKKKDMGRIYRDDPMARYLHAQPDDIIRIIRETVNSGYSTYYRLVVPGSIYN
jgi:DNA-directed RNA polymerase subunit H (RpoH/RPB5)